MSKLLLAFDASGKNTLLKRQTEALAREFQCHYKIYKNVDTRKYLFEAASIAYHQGYTSLYVLTEAMSVAEVELSLRKLNLFDEVATIPETGPRIQEKGMLLGGRLTLLEANVPAPKTVATAQPKPVTSPILVLGFLNANPMVKGHAALLNEILQKDVSALVPQYLPNFSASGWDTKVIRHVFLLPPSSQTHAPIPSDFRAGLLTTGIGEARGLYGEKGVSPNAFGLTADKFFLGDRSTPIFTAIQQRYSKDKISNIIVLSPNSQVSEVAKLFQGQKEYNVLDGNNITVVPLAASDVDIPDDTLVAQASKIGDECAWDEKKAATKEKKKFSPQPLTPGDYFALSLIMVLHGIKTGKIAINETQDNRPGSKRGQAFNNFLNVWAALPEGDRQALSHVANSSGVGDLVGAGKDIVKFGATVAGVGGKEAKVDEKEIEQLTKLTKISSVMGYDILEVINHSEFKTFKSKLDL